jgi:hypothetical protein
MGQRLEEKARGRKRRNIDESFEREQIAIERRFERRAREVSKIMELDGEKEWKVKYGVDKRDVKRKSGFEKWFCIFFAETPAGAMRPIRTMMPIVN